MRGAIVMAIMVIPARVVSAGTSVPDDSGETSEPDATEPDDSGPPSASAPLDTTEGGDESSPYGSPEDIQFQIDIMTGVVSESEMQEFWDEQSRQHELKIQQCMNDAGFDYAIQVFDQDDFIDPMADMTPLEYAEQYGFGTWTMMDPENNPYNEQEFDDPNAEFTEGMSEEELNAYYGVMSTCQNDTYQSGDIYRNPMVQQMQEDLTNQVTNDPRIREASEAWVACMEAAGHPYPSIDEMYEEFQSEDMWEAQQPFYESEAWLATSPDHAEWQQHVDNEIAVAVANADCEPPFRDANEEVYEDIQAEMAVVWQTIDWDLPPNTYEWEADMEMSGEMVVEGIGDLESTEPEGTGELTGTTEAETGLDLGDPTETTET